jgi:hypothetical protein
LIRLIELGVPATVDLVAVATISTRTSKLMKKLIEEGRITAEESPKDACVLQMKATRVARKWLSIP